VRELFNTVQRAHILADDELDLRTAASCGPLAAAAPAQSAEFSFRPGMSLAQVERAVITQTLQHCAGNKTRTAAVLGISLKTLYNRLNEYRSRE
jgi:DNA-binding NtrC family response regulator